MCETVRNCAVDTTVSNYARRVKQRHDLMRKPVIDKSGRRRRRGGREEERENGREGLNSTG